MNRTTCSKCLLFTHQFYNFLLTQVPTTNEDVAILGLPESVLEGQEVDFNCTISRILPPAKNMFWILNGQMIKQSVETFKNEDGTFRHSITFNYT